MRKLSAMDGCRRHFAVRMALFILPAVLMIVATAVFIADRGDAVLGPASGTYTEANGDIIEICSDAACTNHTTSFAPNTRVYLRVTTTRVSSNASGGNIQLQNYKATSVATGAWTQTSATSPYTYAGSVLIPASTPNYLKVYGLVRNGTPRIQFELHLDITTLPNQYMRFFSDAAHTDESYTFKPGAVVYITAYGSGTTYSPANTGNRNALYDFTNAATYRWATAPAVTQSTNWYNFSLTLPSTGLTDGNWYNLRTWLRDTGAATIERMSDMIQIDNTAPAASITSPAGSTYIQGLVPVNGTASDATSFYSYKLEYGAGAAPSTWTMIGATAYTSVIAGLLQTWNTAGVTDGLYTLRLTVTDRAYNVSTASVQVNVDNNPPTITNVASSAITGSSATITWNTTDKAADSAVYYGTSSGNYGNPATVAGLTNSHSVPLSSLTQGTLYYYKVCSTEAGGNTACSSEYMFTTAFLTILQPYNGVGIDTEFGTGQQNWNWGGDQFLRIGDLASDPNIITMRSVIKFDLSGIPADANVLSANLSLYQIAQADTSAPFLVAYAMNRGWTPGTLTGAQPADGATWNTYDGVSGHNWAAAGGDYGAFLGWTTGATSTGSWVNWSLNTTNVKSWVSNPANNYGLLIKNFFENAAANELKRFYSSEYTGDASLRPKLAIEWTPVSGSGQKAPNIGEVRAENIHLSTADIKWSTDENASSQVYYGTSTSYGAWTATDGTLLNQHVVPLSSLSPDMDYHFKVVSIDASANRAESADQIFHTAKQIIITTSKDTWISGAAANQNLNYGGSTDINVGENGATEARRGILEFDLSSIPLGSTVNSATLSVYQHAQADTSTPQLGVFYVSSAKAWTQGTGNGTATGDGATWMSYDGKSADTWAGPGGDGDFNPVASATVNALDTSLAPNWVNWDVGALAQSWVSGSIANNGIFIKKTSGSGATDYKSFYSSEYGDLSLRPQLVIEYVPAPISITMTVNGTYNRDGSSGGSAVDFGAVDPLKPYIVGSSASPPPAPPPYAVELSLKSNGIWNLSVAAATDLLLQSNPADFIDISDLKWRTSGSSGSWRPYQKTSDPITSGVGILVPMTFDYDYQLDIPGMATIGNYNTSIVYTAACGA